MTIDEYKAALEKMMKEPETAAASAVAIIDALKEDAALLAATKKAVEERDAKIAKIDNSNTELQRMLFMSRFGEPQQPPEDNPDEPLGIAELMAKYGKENVNGNE